MFRCTIRPWTMSETAGAYNVPRGAAYFTSQQVVSYIAYFLFYIILARLLTKAEIGQVSLLAAALAVFNTLTQLALPATATRYISSSLGKGQREDGGAVARTALRIILVVSVPGTIIAIVLSPTIGPIMLGRADATLLLVTTFLAGLLLDFTALYGGYFLGVGLFAQTVYQNILYIPLSRGMGLVLVGLGLGVLGIPLGWATGGAATLIISVYFWRNRLPSGTAYPAGPLLQFTMPLFASTLITLGQQWGDITLLQTLLGQLSTTGAYYLVVSSVGFLSVLWTPVSSALYPALSSDHSSNDTDAIVNRLSLATRLTNLAVLPLAAALAAVSTTALEVAYGPAYSGETLPFAILTLTSIFTAQAAILTITLQAVGETRSLLQVTLVATIIDLATVSTMARLLGPTAGASGRALLYATTVLLSQRILRPAVKVSPFRGFRKATMLAVSVGLPLFAMDQILITLNVTALLRLPVLLAVFLGSFVAVSRKGRIFHPGDFTILKGALPRGLQPYLRTLERLIVV